MHQTELFRTGRREPIEINSALVSAQNRRRLYWTNIQGIKQPEDKGILLKDIIENGEVDRNKSCCLLAGYDGKFTPDRYLEKGIHQGIITGGAFRGKNETGKSNALTSVSKDSLCIEIGKADIKGTDSIKRVYSVEGKSPCLNTCQGGHHEPKIAVKDSIYNNRAERIYNEKSPTEQRLEINETGKSNALTSVSKDSVCIRYTKDGFHKFRNDKKKSSIQGTHVTYPEGKTHCLDNHIQSVGNNITWRKLTPIECERLQTVPDNYTAHVSNSQRYKMLGNGWTVDVIAHIFRGINSAECIKLQCYSEV